MGYSDLQDLKSSEMDMGASVAEKDTGGSANVQNSVNQVLDIIS